MTPTFAKEWNPPHWLMLFIANSRRLAVHLGTNVWTWCFGPWRNARITENRLYNSKANPCGSTNELSPTVFPLRNTLCKQAQRPVGGGIYLGIYWDRRNFRTSSLVCRRPLSGHYREFVSCSVVLLVPTLAKNHILQLVRFCISGSNTVKYILFIWQYVVFINVYLGNKIIFVIGVNIYERPVYLRCGFLVMKFVMP